MNWRLVFLLAGRIALDSRQRGFRAIRGPILAVALSLIPLVVVMVMADGMIEGITSRFLELATYHAQLHPRPGVEGSELVAAQTKLSELPGVKLVVPERQGVALAYSEKGRSGATIRALPHQIWARDEGMRRYLTLKDGALDLDGPEKAVIGAELARKLKVKAGDEIKLVTARPAGNGGVLPRISTFKVAGIFSTGYHEMDKLWVFMDFERGGRIMGREASRVFLGVKLHDPFGAADGFLRSAAALLGDSYMPVGWYDLEKGQYMSLATTKAILVFITALILCVAAVNISSALVMLQLERREAVAILKSCGMRGSELEAVFVLLGLFVGAAGTAIGLALGLSVGAGINEVLALIESAVNAALGLLAGPAREAAGAFKILNPELYLDRIPIRVQLFELWAVAVFSLLLAVFSSFLAARRAGRLRPLEVFRRH